MSFLSIRNVSFSVLGQQILKNVTLDVQEGQVIGLIGPNGSGKTTLLNVLSGLLSAGGGTMSMRGKDITHLSATERSRIGIGRVFQNFGIFREMTVAENVLVALESLQREKRVALGNLQRVVEQTLKTVHLQSHAEKKASSLSGGQMRLLEIVRTLASGKDIFLLDEPTAGVSPKMTSEVAALILELKKQGKTILIVEHDLPFIQKICDHVVAFDLGEIVLEGTPEEIRSNAKLKELYFGADPTQ